MTHKTKGIVLRTIKYGETSLIVTVFTELFGVQTYMVNGIRTAKKAGLKAAMYQPSALLEMEVYHNELKGMNRIKECNWAFLYKNILNDVVKNCIALYMMELLYKTLKQPEENSDLFYFCEDALMQLDSAPVHIAANFPIYFTLHLTNFFGFRMNELSPYVLAKYSTESPLFIDLAEGAFTLTQPAHANFISGEDAWTTAEFLKIMQVHELDLIKLNRLKRRTLLLKYQDYYALHIADFGQLKTLQVLFEILG